MSLFDLLNSSNLDGFRDALNKASSDELEQAGEDGLTLLKLAVVNGDIEFVKLLLEKRVSILEDDSGSALHIASEGNNNTEIVKLLIDAKANLRGKTSVGMTPLHQAVFGDAIDVVRILLEAKAPIQAQTMMGDTPLHLAAAQGSKDIVELLVGNGACVVAPNNDEFTAVDMAADVDDSDLHELLESKKSEQMQLGPMLLQCVENEDEEGVKSMLSKGAHVECCENIGHSFGTVTALQLACLHGFGRIAETLLERGGSISKITNEYLGNALHAACIGGYLEIIEMILEEGGGQEHVTSVVPLSGDNCLHLLLNRADARVLNAVWNGHSILHRLLRNKNGSGETPLMMAAKNGRLDSLKVILDKSEGDDVEAALELAVQNGHHDTVACLKTKIVANKNSSNEASKLFETIEKGELEQVVVILKKLKNFDSVVNDDGLSPLQYAASLGAAPIVKALLQSNAQVDRTSTSTHNTALHEACGSGSLECVRTLLAAKASASAKNSEQLSVLHFAIFGENVQVIKEILNCRGDINDRTSLGDTPLHVACQSGTLGLVQLMIESKSQVSSKNDEGKSALDMAKEMTNMDIVNYLSEMELGLVKRLIAAIDSGDESTAISMLKSSDFDDKSKVNGFVEDSTPLIAACKSTKKIGMNLFRMLVERGASLDLTRKKDGCTALHVAIDNDRDDAVSFLVQYGANIDYCGKKCGFLAAVAKGKAEMVRVMLGSNNDDDEEKKKSKRRLVNDVVDAHGHSALFLGVKNREVLAALLPFVEDWKGKGGLLLEWGYDNNNGSDDHGVMGLLEREMVNAGVGAMALEAAIVHENITAIQRLTSPPNNLKPDIIFESSSKSPLSLACHLGHAHIIEYLIKQLGASTGMLPGTIVSPLHEACQFGSLSCVQFLLHASADTSVLSVTPPNYSPLHFAVLSENIDLIRLIASEQLDLEVKSGDDGNTPLHLAASNGHLQVCKALIESGCWVKTVNDKSQTALDIAESHDRSELVQFLKNFPGRESILFDAVVNSNKTNLKKAVMRGISLDARNEDGRDALMLACATKASETVVKLLLELKSNPCSEGGVFGSPLGEAAAAGTKEIFCVLLEAKADPDANASSLLNGAVLGRNLDILDMVMKMKRNSLDELDKKTGESALHVAARIGSTEIVEILVNGGANDAVVSGAGMTALEIADKEKHDGVVLILGERKRKRLEMEERERNERKRIEEEEADKKKIEDEEGERKRKEEEVERKRIEEEKKRKEEEEEVERKRIEEEKKRKEEEEEAERKRIEDEKKRIEEEEEAEKKKIEEEKKRKEEEEKKKRKEEEEEEKKRKEEEEEAEKKRIEEEEERKRKAEEAEAEKQRKKEERERKRKEEEERKRKELIERKRAEAEELKRLEAEEIERQKIMEEKKKEEEVRRRIQQEERWKADAERKRAEAERIRIEEEELRRKKEEEERKRKEEEEKKRERRRQEAEKKKQEELEKKRKKMEQLQQQQQQQQSPLPPRPATVAAGTYRDNNNNGDDGSLHRPYTISPNMSTKAFLLSYATPERPNTTSALSRQHQRQRSPAWHFCKRPDICPICAAAREMNVDNNSAAASLAPLRLFRPATSHAATPPPHNDIDNDVNNKNWRLKKLEEQGFSFKNNAPLSDDWKMDPTWHTCQCVYPKTCGICRVLPKDILPDHNGDEYYPQEQQSRTPSPTSMENNKEEQQQQQQVNWVRCNCTWPKSCGVCRDSINKKSKMRKPVKAVNSSAPFANCSCMYPATCILCKPFRPKTVGAPNSAFPPVLAQVLPVPTTSEAREFATMMNNEIFRKLGIAKTLWAAAAKQQQQQQEKRGIAIRHESPFSQQVAFGARPSTRRVRMSRGGFLGAGLDDDDDYDDTYDDDGYEVEDDNGGSGSGGPPRRTAAASMMVDPLDEAAMQALLVRLGFAEMRVKTLAQNAIDSNCLSIQQLVGVGEDELIKLGFDDPSDHEKIAKLRTELRSRAMTTGSINFNNPAGNNGASNNMFTAESFGFVPIPRKKHQISSYLANAKDWVEKHRKVVKEAAAPRDADKDLPRWK